MIRHILCIASALLFCISLQAQRTNIVFDGSTDNGAGKRIVLLKYSDPLSQVEQEVDATTIDTDGTFRLEAYANYPELMVLQIDNYSQTLYVEPGRTYTMHLPEFDWSIDERQNVLLAPVGLPFHYDKLPADELNISIARYDDLVDSFIYANRLHFDYRLRPNRLYYDTLCMLVKKKVPNTTNQYFNRYKRFRLATLGMDLGFISKTKIYNEYIQGQPVMYYDDNYMHLFLSLYKNRISRGSRYLRVEDIASMVDRGDLHNLLDSLGLDPLLRNEQVRELAALQALGEAYYRSYYYNTDKVLQMIEKLGNNSKFSDHKALAVNLATQLRKESTIAPLPDFSLPNVDKEHVALSSLKGRWVYLNFVRVGEPACISELETMAHFYDSVCRGDSSVVFLTVCCDREFQKMYHLLKNSRRGSRYKWQWLHFGGNYKLLEQYGVASYPTFILINPEGKREYVVTPAPATGFLTNGPWIKKKDEPEKPEFFLNGN